MTEKIHLATSFLLILCSTYSYLHISLEKSLTNIRARSSIPNTNATFVHLDISVSQANCNGDRECLRTVSSRLGRDFMYLYSTNSTPAGPAYMASGTPPVYVSWIFHLYTSG